MIAALSRYDDEMQELKKAGIQVVFDLYAEAGAGYAEHIAREISKEKTLWLIFRGKRNKPS